jgi:transcriptional regulator of acetoin/glycerol metabolism
MGLSERSASSLDTIVGHAEHVYSVAEGATPPLGIQAVSSSWQRSAKKHGLDPLDSQAPRILTAAELKYFREPLDKLIFTARQEMNELYEVVREAGYTVLLCDSSGVAVAHRGENALASHFQYWGTWLGGVWSEEVEGTNGIGTVIAEERPITVHRTQHFRSRHTNLSCSGAPVFGVDGRLIAVLDVSAIDPELSERAHALTGVLTVRSARAIEERFFREQFRREWIVAVAPPACCWRLTAANVSSAQTRWRARPSCSTIAGSTRAPACGRFSSGTSTSSGARTEPISLRDC